MKEKKIVMIGSFPEITFDVHDEVSGEVTTNRVVLGETLEEDCIRIYPVLLYDSDDVRTKVRAGFIEDVVRQCVLAAGYHKVAVVTTDMTPPSPIPKMLKPSSHTYKDNGGLIKKMACWLLGDELMKIAQSDIVIFDREFQKENLELVSLEKAICESYNIPHFTIDLSMCDIDSEGTVIDAKFVE